MPSCEVQRTLVKSPPELWAELSDPAALARHLGEFGEIRTTRVEPETAVEWEAEAVRGVVQLKASGWGTKVTLTVVREAPATATPDSHEAAPATAAAPGTTSEAAPTPETHSEAAIVAAPQQASAPAAIEPEATPELVAQPQAAEPEPQTSEEPDPEPVRAPELEAESAEPEPALAPAASSRRGFFARLFRRRRGEQPSPAAAAPEPSTASSVPPDTFPELTAGPSELATAAEPTTAAAEPAPSAPEPATAGAELASSAPAPPTTAAEPAIVLPEPAGEQAAPTQAAQPQPQIEDRPDLSAELAQVEAAMLEQDTALLTAVLDRLGAAHHRPFSRG